MPARGLWRARGWTRQNFGYDVAKWREFLRAHDEEFGYRHPYAFAAVDRAVKAAAADAGFARLAASAAVDGREWEAAYDAKTARKSLPTPRAGARRRR